MKRYTFLILLLFSSTLVVKARTNDEQLIQMEEGQPKLLSDSISRKGNTYLYANQSMNKYEYRDFLSTRCTPAYERFCNGYRIASVGWGFFGTGLTIEVAGIGLYCAAIVRGYDNTNNDLSTGLGNATASAFMLVLGTIVCTTGGIIEVASIPMLCVGYSRMHNSVDVYNIDMHQKPSLSLGVGSSTNGVGIALCF